MVSRNRVINVIYLYSALVYIDCESSQDEMTFAILCAEKVSVVN